MSGKKKTGTSSGPVGTVDIDKERTQLKRIFGTDNLTYYQHSGKITAEYPGITNNIAGRKKGNKSNDRT